MTRSGECPGLARIVEHAYGVRKADGADVASHVERCEPCRLYHDWLMEVIALSAAGRMPEPPAAWIDRAAAIVHAKPRRTPSLRTTLARLVHDTLSQPIPAAGVRGVSAARRLLFEFDEGHVDLEIEPVESSRAMCDVRGQIVLEEDLNDGTVLLAGEVVRAKELDATGVFQFPRVPGGEYRLEILTASERVMMIETLHVGDVS